MIEDSSDMFYRRVFTDTVWEKQVGYCRAVRAGNQVFVTGCAPVADGGGVYAPGNAYEQAKRCFEIVRDGLRSLDADLSHVVRTRMFVTDITRWAEYGRAHQEFLGGHPPATSMVEVQALIDPEMLIEIEADAVCPPVAPDPVSQKTTTI